MEAANLLGRIGVCRNCRVNILMFVGGDLINFRASFANVLERCDFVRPHRRVAATRFDGSPREPEVFEGMKIGWMLRNRRRVALTCDR